MSSALDKARANMSRLRQRARQMEPVRAISAFAGGALIGALRRNGTVPVSAFGMPTTPLIAGLLHVVATSTSGTYASALHGAADGMFGAYGFAASMSGSLIAGDENISGQLISGEEIGDEEDTRLGLG